MTLSCQLKAHLMTLQTELPPNNLEITLDQFLPTREMNYYSSFF